MIKNNVLIGRDGWLFLYGGAQNQFDYLRCIEKVSEDSVKNFVYNITSRVNYFKSKSIEYKHVIFPSKPLLKQRFIPEDYSDITSLFTNYYQDALGDALCDVIHPLKELETLEQEHSTFHKYNTHNSDYGYLKIANTIGMSLGLGEVPQSYYNFTKINIGGGLATMLGIPDESEEDFIKLNPMNTYSTGNRKFLPGNTNDVYVIHNEEAITSKRLIIFGDSFFKGTLKFLKIYFTDILYIRSQFIHKDIIENFQPDTVLSGNAERYLRNVESDKNANNFLLALYGENKFNPSEEYLEAFQACTSYRHYNHIYQNWIKKITTKGFENKIKLDASHKDADIFREVALYFERNGNLDAACILMEEALKSRPNGPFLMKKIQEYKQGRVCQKGD